MNAPAADATERVRLDCWLWAARFYKTRTLAKAAVTGGKVHCNGVRVKPAKPVASGDELTVTRGEVVQTVLVTAVSARRRGAKEAATLYAETPSSVARRDAIRAQRRHERAGMTLPARRPDKRERRRLRQVRAGS